MAIDWNLASIIIFYLCIGLFFWLRRSKINVQYNILFLYKSKFWAKQISKIAKKSPRFWQWFGYASIPVAFIGMIVILGFLTWKFIEMLIVPGTIPAVSPVLPGIKIPGSPIFLPFWYGILALAFIIIVHEFAHGFVAESWGAKLKSAGVGMLALLPLAFVEPDPKKLKRLPLKKQLSIYGAGPFSNLVWALVIFLILTFAVIPATANILEPNGLYVEKTMGPELQEKNLFTELMSTTPEQEPLLPAKKAGIKKGNIITKINDQEINTTKDFVNYMENVNPSDVITMQIDGDLVELKTIENPENKSEPYIGIQFSQNVDATPEAQEKYGIFAKLLFYLAQLLNWIFVLNIGIGLINLLPLGIMDGGQMLRAVLSKKVKRKRLIKTIWTIFVTVSLFLLLMNLIGPYFLGF
ncbi:PDZ domain-containing protein [Candidatus Woesearchaeota archaeon]|nr:PDZ domain-containing protein [Candidatus Woesearchaeota archaeon]